MESIIIKSHYFLSQSIEYDRISILLLIAAATLFIYGFILRITPPFLLKKSAHKSR